MKSLLLIAAAIILFLALPLIVWRLVYDPLERHVAPLAGNWLSTHDHSTILRIRIDETGGSITIGRGTVYRESTYPLRFEGCLYYVDSSGKRIDMFYAPKADVLLLMPGGTYQRIPNFEKNE